MGQASASSSSTSANQQTGGNITNGTTNYAPWIIAGLVVLLLGFYFLLKRR